MISFLCGVVVDIDASMVIVDVNGVGYKVNISLRTFSKIFHTSGLKKSSKSANFLRIFCVFFSILSAFGPKGCIQFMHLTTHFCAS